MAIASNILPSKCCCCSLRAGSIVVGSFSLIFSLVFLGLFAALRSSMALTSCSYENIGDAHISKHKYICVPLSEKDGMVANLMALLSILNAVEVIMSVGLIWGASKRILNWVNAYMVTLTCWIFLHSAIAIAYIFATMTPVWIILISLLGIMIWGLALLSMLTVYSFREEMKSSLLVSSMQSRPTVPSSDAAGHQASLSGQTQFPNMQASAPIISHVRFE